MTRKKMALADKIFKLVPKTIYNKGLLKYQANARFPSMCWAPGMHFWATFTKKQNKTKKQITNYNHHSGENHRIRKNNLVMKTIYKKIFLKYQANTRLPSLCLASGNSIFGKGDKNIGNAIRGSHQGMGCPNDTYILVLFPIWLIISV